MATRPLPRIAAALCLLVSCAQPATYVASAPQPTTAPTTDPVYDTTLPKPVPPRDRLEREVVNRDLGLRLVDKLMDGKTEPPPFRRSAKPPRPPEARIAGNVSMLSDTNPFPEPVPLESKEVTIDVGVARSTFRTREPEEVLSAVEPFIDLVQREVNIRGRAHLHETPEEIFYALLDGKEQLVVANVFEYLRCRDWLANEKDNGSVLLAWAKPARPRVTDLDRAFEGTPGTCIELIVAADSPFQKPADLAGKRLALAANIVPGPGTFMTRLLSDLGQAPGAAFFGHVSLRRYAKDAVIDVLKGKTDAACVDQGTVGALARFYGIAPRIRTIAISPRYNMDVLYTSQNNVQSHRTEIELTQRQLTTLPKDPEGQEVLFFFDTDSWQNYAEDDIAVPRAHYDDYLKFLNDTPVDLKPLLDPNAPVDRKTYTRLGDE